MPNEIDTDIDSWNDSDSRILLRMLHKYVMRFEPDLPLQVEDLAEDLASSLDETTNQDDEMYQEIARAYHWDRVSQAPQDRLKKNPRQEYDTEDISGKHREGR